MLYVKELIKRYGQQTVLKNFSASFQTGAINVVIGASGCGKTSLFQCISGLESFEFGTITLNDQVIAEARNRRPTDPTAVGYVLQGFSLFAHLTVLDNLTLAPRLVYGEPRGEAEARARILLEKMQITEKQNEYPSRLSGGQQQRVAIARAIMMGPKVLLMDEPTTALDPQLVRSLERLLRTLADEGFTLIISTHHLDFARHIADHSIFMQEGRALAESDKANLLDDHSVPEIERFVREDGYADWVGGPPPGESLS